MEEEREGSKAEKGENVSRRKMKEQRRRGKGEDNGVFVQPVPCPPHFHTLAPDFRDFILYLERNSPKENNV